MRYYIVPKDELYHHGVKGMKWGVRKQPQSLGGIRGRQQLTAQQIQDRRKKIKRAAAVGGVVVSAGLAAYGGYKYRELKGKNRAFTVNELRRMGISTIEPDRIDVHRIDVFR